MIHYKEALYQVYAPLPFPFPLRPNLNPNPNRNPSPNPNSSPLGMVWLSVRDLVICGVQADHRPPLRPLII